MKNLNKQLSVADSLVRDMLQQCGVPPAGAWTSICIPYELYARLRDYTDGFKRRPTAEDYFFTKNDDGEGFFLVSKDFWYEHGYIDDRDLGSDVEGILPTDFEEVQESLFERYSKSTNKCDSQESMRQALLDAGFTELA